MPQNPKWKDYGKIVLSWKKEREKQTGKCNTAAPDIELEESMAYLKYTHAKGIAKDSFRILIKTISYSPTCHKQFK